MIVLLVLAADDATAALVGQVASAAGCHAMAVREDELAAATERLHPDGLLVDAGLALDAATIPAARRGGVRVLYFSTAMSAWALAEHARRRGVPHWAPLSCAAGLRRALAGEVPAADAPPIPALDPRHVPIHEHALDVAGQSRQLRQRSTEAIATSRELRAAREVRLAACHASREALRASIVTWTRTLRGAGTPLDRIVALVRAAVAEGVRETTGAAATGERLDEASRWAEEAWRAA